MGVRIRAVDDDDVQHESEALVGAATVTILRFPPAPVGSGGRYGVGAPPPSLSPQWTKLVTDRPNTGWPLPRRGVIDHARVLCGEDLTMIGIVDVERAEVDLAAGELACPGCGGPLRRWGHARAREVRDTGSRMLRLRPRRARCSSCGGTHVLLLTAVLPRRADTTAVIGTALQASTRGIGCRRIATQLGRPASTVRRWIHAVRTDHHRDWLREQGIEWITRVDREVLATLTPQPTRLGEALSALAAAALTLRAHLAPHVPPWTLIGQITHGRLVTPASTG